ncbi:MAG: hypothetical protein CMK09_06025 [Ponticaulis sp.]|nr:hypothetical protein [Ponticaulis sp.]|tara:strand:- start:21969 stop:22868 length:900 start_codon:yes stop_codon:yes gene_type:complete
MAFWSLVQQNSEAVLSEGARAFLKQDTIRKPSSVPDSAGVFAFIANADTFYVGETDNLRKTLLSQTNPKHSKFYKAYRAGAAEPVYALSDFSIRVLPVSFGRVELMEALRHHIPAVFATSASGARTVVQLPGPVELWDRLQGIAFELLANGGRECLTTDPQSFGRAPSAGGPGILTVSSPDGEVIHIGASEDIGKTYLDHLRSTYRSELRRNLGKRVLGYRLRTRNGEARYFSENDDRNVSDYVRRCQVAFTTIRVGREEIRDDLIRRMRPILNDLPRLSPFEKQMPSFDAGRKRALFG